MSDKIKLIIESIDNYLERTGKQIVEANEVALELDRLGIFNFSTKGQPFRKLLREGLIPNASQPGGKNTSWFIRHSHTGVQHKSSTLQSLLSKERPTQSVSLMKSGLSPLIDDESKFLILGTLPGDESLRKQEYYANPSNRIWNILSKLNGETTPLTYSDKKSLLKRMNVALWDVLKEAERKGSLDSNIHNSIANDIIGLLKGYPKIRVIGLNGNTATELFNKHVNQQDIPICVQVVSLRSTSQANRRFSLEYMLNDWSRVFK